MFLGKDGLRHRLRTPCNSEHTVSIGQHVVITTPTNGRRITLQPNLCQSPHVIRRDRHHTQNWLVQNITRPIRIRKHSAYLAGALPHVKDVYVAFHVQFKVLLANGIGLHLERICGTVQAHRDIWHTGQQRDKRVVFHFPLIISALTPQYRIHQFRGVTRCATKDRTPM